jgi:hypothetical protein
MAQGMLSRLFEIPPSDPAAQKEEERLQALAKMNPFDAAAYTAYSGGAQAGQGIGKALAGLTGRDVRAPAAKRTDAIEAVRERMSKMGYDPNDPKAVETFQKQFIQLLQQQGMGPEALDIQRDFHTQKVADEKLSLESEKIKAGTARDKEKQAAVDERNKILAANGAPELAKMIKIAESFDPVLEAPLRKKYVEALNAMMEGKKKGIVLADAGGFLQPLDRATGLPLGEKITTTAAPMNEKDKAKATEAGKAQASAYRNAFGNLQADYDVTVRLYNHPGVSGITGRINRLVGEPGTAGQIATTAASGEARAALDLWKQVTGATFLAGLNALKAASPTGSTGLGQTSNIEGDKVQNAKAALSREQDAPDFRLNLKVYIESLEDQGARLNAAAAQGNGTITPLSLQVRPLNAVPGARPAPARARPAAPAPAGDTVKVTLPDGRTGVIPRANLEAAKAAGAVEAK